MTKSKLKRLSKAVVRSQPDKKVAAKAIQAKGLSPSRILLVWGVLVLAVVGLAGRLFYWQIVNPVVVYPQAPQGKKIKQIAKSQHLTKLRFYMPRRQIVDRQDNVIATDRITYELYAHPYIFRRNSVAVPSVEVAEQLGTILQLDPEKLLELFRQKDRGIRIASNLPESVKEKITDLRIDGLELIQNYFRFYPHQEMMAEIVGYMNRDSKPRPQAGVEYTQDKLLERSQLSWIIKRSFIQREGKEEPIYHPGNLSRSQQLVKFDELSLQLTVDLRLQQAARQALQQAMEEYKAKRGTVIVMDVQDGSILALVCQPTYDPNRYYDYDLERFKNWAIADLYEPGSTFKPINVAIALDAGVINPNDQFEDTGKIKVDGWNIRNHDYETEGQRGLIGIAKILQHSSNVGMIKIINRLDRSEYYQRLQELGIEEKLDFEIPGYAPGHLKDEIEFKVKSIEAATTAFGQGFSLTPLKLIQLHAAIANGGKLVTPHVVRGLADFDGYLHWQPPLHSKTIFSPATSRAVLNMMETVVTQGSGKVAEIPGYRIAGKTGTAQKAGSGGGYDEQAKITSFVGIFPVEAPRYAVLAVVDEPKGKYTFGSTVAAPIVKSVIEALIAIEGIPPSTLRERPNQVLPSDLIAQ